MITVNQGFKLKCELQIFLIDEIKDHIHAHFAVNQLSFLGDVFKKHTSATNVVHLSQKHVISMPGIFLNTLMNSGGKFQVSPSILNRLVIFSNYILDFGR